MKLVAIDIGSNRMKFVVGKAGKKKITIKNMFTVQTPADAVNNGEIVDISLMREALTVAVHNHKLGGKKAIVTIQSGSFISREFTMPCELKKNEVESALRFEVEQFMPINLSDYVLNYRELGATIDENGRNNIRYLVGLMPLRIVTTYHNLLKSAGLKPIVMDVNFNAIEKFLNFGASSRRYDNAEVILVADIGHDAMDMTVFEKGCPQINRTVSTGGSEITRSIGSAFGLDFEEAERKKVQSVDMMAFEVNMALEDRGLNDVAKAIVTDWTEQLRRMIEFYMSRTKGKGIDCVYIYGGSSSIKRLDEYLSTAFNLSVRLVKLPDNVQIKKEPPIPAHNFLNAIGAIIRM